MQFLFEDHVLDIDRRELRRGAQQIAVGPQVFDLLVYLVQNRERVVTKDDLLDAIWSGRFVSESNLTTRINAARKAIVEPVIGQIKHARGFRQFLLRGFQKVQGEWSLVCTTHNILKLYRLCV